jgi:hypothetical protein
MRDVLPIGTGDFRCLATIAALAYMLVKDDAHRGGKIQTADPGLYRYLEGIFTIAIEKGCRQPPCFGAEHHENTLRRGHLPVRTLSAFGHQHDLAAGGLHLSGKMIKIIPNLQRHFGPVIQAGPFDLPRTQGKSQRPYQMQRSPCAQAGTTDIAGIPVHLRRHQDHMAVGRAEFIAFRHACTLSSIVPIQKRQIGHLRTGIRVAYC